jgi:glyoxylase-like metal-dependent hydrolase (beta-lactamase superfamily II)
VTDARLHLIDLDQDIEGQRRFISCWTSLSDDLNFVVDPGPPSTADHLVAELAKLGVERLDFILLTHVHLDHGGCTAQVLQRYPQAKVVCSERGRPHLIDPSRLWEGSKQVLRAKALVYGEPTPVADSALATLEEAAARGIETIPTPGHAPHHVAFRNGDHLFLGEAAGTFSTLGRGSDTSGYYLRPATPPRFVPDVYRKSIDRLLALDPFPARLLFAHHGEHTGDGRKLLEDARAQVDTWIATVRDTLATLESLTYSEQPEDEHALLTLCRRELTKVDPVYVRGAALPDDIRQREQDFTNQTLRGILGHLKERAKGS